MESMNPHPFLCVSFLFSSLMRQLSTQPLSFLAHLLGLPEEGGFLYRLRQKGWATDVSAQSLPLGRYFIQFEIIIALTKQGELCHHSTVDLFFEFLEHLLRDFKYHVYHDFRTWTKYEFHYMNKLSPLDTTAKLAHNLRFYESEKALMGANHLGSYAWEELQCVLMRFERCNAVCILCSNTLDGLTKQEPCLGTKFEIEERTVKKEFCDEHDGESNEGNAESYENTGGKNFWLILPPRLHASYTHFDALLLMQKKFLLLLPNTSSPPLAINALKTEIGAGNRTVDRLAPIKNRGEEARGFFHLNSLGKIFVFSSGPWSLPPLCATYSFYISIKQLQGAANQVALDIICTVLATQRRALERFWLLSNAQMSSKRTEFGLRVTFRGFYDHFKPLLDELLTCIKKTFLSVLCEKEFELHKTELLERRKNSSDVLLWR